VGGAKLVHGLAQVLAPNELTVIVNTGDDFNFLGLRICPDLDTVCYTLAGLSNPDTGWGRIDETWNAMRNLVELGGPDWFHLGDNDLGTHLERTRRLSNGERLSKVTNHFCTRWGIRHPILPMTDDDVATWINTHEKGWLSFQEYFVREKCDPRVISFEFKGVQQAKPSPGIAEALEQTDWVIICPSNPWVSIDPILSTGAICDWVRKKPTVAVSPIIGGKAVKGPAAKMYHEMGIIPSAAAVATHYLQRLQRLQQSVNDTNDFDARCLVFYIDSMDLELAPAIREMGIEVVVADTIMNTVQSRRSLAENIIHMIKNKYPEGGGE